MDIKKIHLHIIAIAASIPLVLWAILLILPTFDDWTTLSSPNYDPHYWQYLLPFGLTWRPGDAIMGYVNAINYELFPTLNHVLILLAHLGSTYIIWRIARNLQLSPSACALSTVFFYWSPCMLGTVLSCDALNQSYAHLWGILAVWCYLVVSGRQRYLGWFILVWLSVLSKDNGLAWAVVPPMVAYAFRRIDRRAFFLHVAFGLAIAISYAVVRLLLPVTANFTTAAMLKMW